MAKFAFLVEMKAKPGKEAEVETFLTKEASLVKGEAGTLSWHAAKIEGENRDLSGIRHVRHRSRP